MTAGEKNGNGFYEAHEIVEDAIEQAADWHEHAADVPPAGAEPAPRPRLVWSFANRRQAEDVPGLLKSMVENSATRSSRAAATPKRSIGASGWRSSRARLAAEAQPLRSMHPEFRTEVVVGDVTVTGVLPGAARPPVGSIAISGDVQRLSCDQALELVDALLLAVTRMDVVVEERFGATINATHDRED